MIASVLSSSVPLSRFQKLGLLVFFCFLTLSIPTLLAIGAIREEDQKKAEIEKSILEKRVVYSSFETGIISSIDDIKEVFLDGKRLTRVKRIVIEFEKYIVKVYLLSGDDGTLYYQNKNSKVEGSTLDAYRYKEVYKKIPLS